MQTSALKYEPVRFSGAQLRGVALGFARAIAESGYLVFACSILPEHIHLVVQRHANPGERIIGHLKGRATQELIAGGIHPFGEYANADGEVPCMWARRGWRVYLHTVEEILRAIRYVEGNPLKQGMPRQEHSFVTPYAARFDGIDPAGLVV